MSQKVFRTLLTGVFLILSMIGLCACEHRLTAMDVSEKMRAAMTEQDSVQMSIHMQMDMDTGMGIGDGNGEALTTTMDTELVKDLQKKQQYFQFSKSVLGMGKDASFESQYLLYEEEKNQIALERVNDDWVFCELPGEVNYSQLPLADEIRSLQDIYTLESEEGTAAGNSCYILKAPLVPEDLNQILGEIFKLTAGSESTYWDEVCNLLGSSSMRSVRATLYIYVDQETNLPISMAIHMNDISEETDTTAAEETETEAETAADSTIISCELKAIELTVEFSFDEIDEITIPEEVYTREELEQQKEDEIEQQYITVLADYSGELSPLLNASGIRIYLQKIYTDQRDDSLNMTVRILNSSSHDVEVFSECIAINGYMLDTGANLYAKLSAGESSEEKLTINDLTTRGITNIQTIKVQVRADDSKDYSIIFSGRAIECKIDAEASYEMSDPENMQLIQETDELLIWAGDPLDTENAVTIPVIIENRTKEGITIDVVSVEDADGSILKGKLQGNIMAGTRLASVLTIEKTYLAQAMNTISEYVNVSFRATDMESLVTLFTADSVKVYTGGEPKPSIIEELTPSEEETETAEEPTDVSEEMGVSDEVTETSAETMEPGENYEADSANE